MRPATLLLALPLFLVAATLHAQEQPPTEAPPLLSAADSQAKLATPDDLKVDLVLAEPVVRQPLFMSWDERGRLWVVQYIQYPYPAGLKMLSRDEYWRAVYDKVPPAPPNHFRGEDVISIHEDTDGDGVYDKHKNFLEGMNIVSSFARGRGGVWVLNPPYLLFYPDANNDDVPDSDPVVHLEGFGMEDTHSVVNSLRFGPDGWLYATQGSTVSGNVLRTGLDKKPITSMGQLVWRYHPETRRYEIFAEGGGNAFGVELDDAARIFSGHNGGNTRGFHYVQGGYSQKGFEKHGPLSNPYTFGYFPPMKHHDVERFTHNFVLYGGGALPEKYVGRLFGVEPLQGRVVLADFERDGSSFASKDTGYAIKSADPNFRPVDIKVGPDGAIYVADFYEPQISHREHFKGNVDDSNGRIYRLHATSDQRIAPFDLGAKTSVELVDVLKHPNRWFRQTALQLIGDRKDSSLVPLLKQNIAANEDQFAVECLWALNLSGGLDEETARGLLQHKNAQVRLWSARVMCDDGEVSPEFAASLSEAAAHETDVDARSQFASSARRLPAAQTLPIVRGLLVHDEDAGDIHLPLLVWWAIEAKAETDRAAVVEFFSDRALWERPLVKSHLLERVMQRYAQAGTRQDLLTCATLLRLSPGQEYTPVLMKGFEKAFEGRSLASLPDELIAALAESGGGSLVLSVRQGKPEAIEEALTAINDPNGDAARRLQLVQVFGEVDAPQCVPVLLDVFRGATDEPLRAAAVGALQRYSEPGIGLAVLEAYGKLSGDVLAVAQTLLASRAVWAKQFVEAVDAGTVAADSVPLDVVRRMTIHPDGQIAELVAKHWSNVEGASNAEMQAQVARVRELLQAGGGGDPYKGKTLYGQTCAKCHMLFGEGGRIGPDLTSHNRDDVLNLLINVVNPSAEIREGFESWLVLTADGRTVNGFLFDKDNQVVVLRGADGQNVTIPQDEVDEMIRQPKSLMPEGMLKDLNDDQVRDLFAYLRTAQPLP